MTSSSSSSVAVSSSSLTPKVFRYAAVAAAMSLSIAEGLAAEAEANGQHAVVAAPDPIKGEALVLLTTSMNLDVDKVAGVATRRGVRSLAVPTRIVRLDEMPILGNGKTDYVTLGRLAGAA